MKLLPCHVDPERYGLSYKGETLVFQKKYILPPLKTNPPFS